MLKGLLVGVFEGLVIGCLLFGWLTLSELREPAPNEVAIWMLPLCGLLLIAFLTISLARRSRRLLGFSAGFLAALLLSAFAFQSLWWTARFLAFEHVAQHAEPITAALQAYQRDQGERPESLDALVPEYLDTLPGTGFAHYPVFAYGAPSSYGDHACWGLYVESYSSSLFGSGDRFEYCPGDWRIDGETRIGDWVYDGPA